MLTHEEEQALAEMFSADVLQAEFHAWCEAMASLKVATAHLCGVKVL